MAKVQLWSLSAVLVLFTSNISFGCIRSSVSATPAPRIADLTAPANVYLCGVCGQPITVSLIVRNNLKSPFFEFQVHLTKPQQELIYFLQNAAKTDPRFKFSADFHQTLGYMINKINGLSSSNSERTYWEILEHPTGNSLELGVSSYVPTNGNVIMFNLTTWGNTSE